jgi:hypothetical protein
VSSSFEQPASPRVSNVGSAMSASSARAEGIPEC